MLTPDVATVLAGAKFLTLKLSPAADVTTSQTATSDKYTADALPLTIALAFVKVWVPVKALPSFIFQALIFFSLSFDEYCIF